MIHRRWELRIVERIMEGRPVRALYNVYMEGDVATSVNTMQATITWDGDDVAEDDMLHSICTAFRNEVLQYDDIIDECPF